ncbi:MAG TPA: hypothetical protein VFL55_05165 [Acetobacteraceae bacterium]|nr:hypothetical protein [Acetobacteraceae bacterium]
MFIWSVARPRLDWDMLAYVAIAYEWSGEPDPHAATYRDAASYAVVHGMTSHDLLTGFNGFRDTVYTDPGAFAEQLPFYRIKLLYVAAVWIGSHLSATYSAAAVWVSAISILLASALVLWFCAQWIGPVSGSIVAAIFALAPSTVQCAGVGLPDGLGTLLVVAGVVLLYHERYLPAALVLLAAILARPEIRLFDACLALALLWHRKVARRRGFWPAIAVLLSALTIGGAVDWLVGSYGYAVLYHYTFLEVFTPHPAALVGLGIPPLSWVRQVFVGAGHALASGFLWSILAPLGVIAMLLPSRPIRPVVPVLLAVGSSIGIRMVLFPDAELRFAEPMLGVLILTAARISAGPTAMCLSSASYGNSAPALAEAPSRRWSF